MPEHTGYLVRVVGGLGSVLLYRHLQPAEAQNELRQEMQDSKNKWTIDRPITIPEEKCIDMASEGEILYVLEGAARHYRFLRGAGLLRFSLCAMSKTPKPDGREETLRRDFRPVHFAYRAFTGDVSIRVPNDLVGDYPVVCAGLHEYSEEELRMPKP